LTTLHEPRCAQRPGAASRKRAGVSATPAGRSGWDSLGVVLVLGIDVDELLLARWHRWLMPSQQPFVLSPEVAEQRGFDDAREALSPELRDSFELYGLTDDSSLVWLTRAQARQLPEAVRHAQPSAHRWPTENRAHDLLRVVRYVESGRRPSRHREIGEKGWQEAQNAVPDGRRLAGSFAERSGPNCFGTVMAAAGIDGADRRWLQIGPFEAWLEDSTRSGGRDDQPGTVLVWRDQKSRPTHAAITLGGGYLLHKPSQGWMSPIKVLTVSEAKYSARTPGRHLSRRQLV
jgi:hypothetical protein